MHFVENVRGNTFKWEVRITSFTIIGVTREKVTQFGLKCITKAHPQHTVGCKKGKIRKTKINTFV